MSHSSTATPKSSRGAGVGLPILLLHWYDSPLMMDPNPTVVCRRNRYVGTAATPLSRQTEIPRAAVEELLQTWESSPTA